MASCGRPSRFVPCLLLVLASFAPPPCAVASNAPAQTPPPARPAPVSAPSPGPTMAEAVKALDAALAEAAKIGVLLSCAVVDSRGDLVALMRMDGARFFTTDIARGKAQVSAMFGEPSGALATFGATPYFTNLNTAAQGRLYPVMGGVPVSRDGRVFGAIACSGASGKQDEDAARAGVPVLER